MPARYDIRLGDDGDLPIETNRLTLAQSDQRHITDAILSFRGWWKQFPSYGAGAGGYLNSSGQNQTIEKVCKAALQSDGYTCGPNLVKTNGDDIIIDQKVVIVS